MKTIKQILLKSSLLLVLLLVFTRCYQDDDMNYRILINNDCDFAIKVYYDNQDIEYYDYGHYSDIDVRSQVTFIPAFGEKIIHSKYTSVWIEPGVSDLKPRKFRSFNDGSWRKRIDVAETDFAVY